MIIQVSDSPEPNPRPTWDQPPLPFVPWYLPSPSGAPRGSWPTGPGRRLCRPPPSSRPPLCPPTPPPPSPSGPSSSPSSGAGRAVPRRAFSALLQSLAEGIVPSVPSATWFAFFFLTSISPHALTHTHTSAHTRVHTHTCVFSRGGGRVGACDALGLSLRFLHMCRVLDPGRGVRGRILPPHHRGGRWLVRPPPPCSSRLEIIPLIFVKLTSSVSHRYGFHKFHTFRASETPTDLFISEGLKY